MAVTTAGDLSTASNLISLHYLGRIKAIKVIGAIRDGLGKDVQRG